MRDLRRDLISCRCAWCKQIWNGSVWLPERRPQGHEIYSHGICEGCAAIHFAGTRDLVHINVTRFGSKPKA